MKKIYIVKIIHILSILAIILITFGSYNVMATDVMELTDTKENIEISDDNEDLILVGYNVKTNEISKINMREIREKISLQKATRNIPNNYTEPIIPNMSKLSNDKNNTPLRALECLYRVKDVTEYPYISTCKIRYEGDNYNNNSATGFMVGPNLMLTAAHCAHNYERFLKEGESCPAYNSGVYKDYTASWDDILIPEIWIEKNKGNTGADKCPEYDWALVILNWDMGYEVGAYGCEAYTSNNSSLNEVYGKLTGYPGGINEARYQYYFLGDIYNTNDRYFNTTFPVLEGMSGAPMMRHSTNYVLGIGKGCINHEQNGYCVRISQNIIDLILSLRTD